MENLEKPARPLVVLAALAALAPACGSSKSSTGFARDAGGDAPNLLGSCGHPDCDGDGYATPADCDDDNPLVNPEAYDFPGDGVDNDCDGTVDDPVLTCETVPTMLPGSPTDFARAADLCAQHAITKTGKVFDPLVNAVWGQVSGLGTGGTLWTSTTKPVQVGLASSFGGNVARLGKTMAGLANGPWQAPDPRNSAALDPPGFNLLDACSDIPLEGTDCASLTGGVPEDGVSVQDYAELEMLVHVPTNVRSIAFDFAFFSSEFNQWWQSAANDAFFVLVTSKNLSGQNVARDSHGLAVTVDSGFFQLCPAPPGPAGLSSDKATAIENCVGPTGITARSIFGTITGTGYDGAPFGSNDPAAVDTATAVDGSLYVYGGGAGWLTASFPVVPGEQLEMRVIILDTFDGLKDSAVLFDHMAFSAGTSTGGIGRPQAQ